MSLDNKYNISLIIENNFVSEVFKEEIEQVKETLQQLSNIKEFNIYQLTANGNEHAILLNDQQESVNILDKKSSENNTHLVLVISDNNSVLWNNTQAYNLLNQLKENSLVGLVNYERLDPLKERSIEMETQIYIDVLPHAKTNKDMKIDNEKSWSSMEHYPHGLFLPATTIDNIGELINSFMNNGKLGLVMIYDNIHHHNFYNTIQNLKDEKKSDYYERKMNAYKYGANVNGYQLAAYFSVIDSFTVSDMQYIQKHMLPESNKKTLNYFALSSLVDKINGDNINGEQRYKIKEDICPILHRSLRNRDANNVELLLKEKNHQNTNIDSKIKVKI